MPYASFDIASGYRTTILRYPTRESGGGWIERRCRGRATVSKARAAKASIPGVDETPWVHGSAAGAPLTGEEQRLRDRLLAGKATRDEGLQLYSSMTGRGLAFPIPWEEIVIGLCLEQEPNRPDLKSRLREVLAMQGKPVPAATE